MLCATVLLATRLAAPGDAADTPAGLPGWCTTTERWAAKAAGRQPVGGSCPTFGYCDDPAARDFWIPDASTPVLTIRLQFHVLAEDDGSNPAATAEEVGIIVSELNADFAPHALQFVYQMRFVNDSTYRVLDLPFEDVEMKELYALAPQSRCNIFITDNGNASFGTFPFDQDALTANGGVVLDEHHADPGDHVATHEVGHNVGLWHTHHGVDEVSDCGPCYETPNGDGDVTGDLCSDTPPTPRNFDCGDPGDIDPCSGLPWGATLFENFMGYGGPGCWNFFTAQQAGRLQCWTSDVLAGWFAPEGCPGDATGDGVIGAADFLILLGAWGACPPDPAPCPSDVDGDGDIGTADLLLLLASWGPCG